ncbi:MAG: DUF6468 domain-containing protein [Pseudomonadota bacterium]
MSPQIALILDGLILVFLCVTIFYAARLSMFLKTFREGKEGMQVLIRDLTTVITRAETALANSKGQMLEAETELRNIINEAKFLSDELKYMTEGGNGLAERLEKLADRNRELVDLMERSGGIGTQKIASVEPGQHAVPEKPYRESDFDITDISLDDELDIDDEIDFQALDDGAYREPEDLEEAYKSPVDTQDKSKVRSFAIFDRDIEEMHIKEQIEEKIKEEVDNHSSDFYSKAEQDLYEALQRRKKMKESG